MNGISLNFLMICTVRFLHIFQIKNTQKKLFMALKRLLKIFNIKSHQQHYPKSQIFLRKAFNQKNYRLHACEIYMCSFFVCCTKCQVRHDVIHALKKQGLVTQSKMSTILTRRDV